MPKKINSKIILISIILVNLFLNIYGNDWGLPSRWHADEKVADVLHMAYQRTIINPIGYFIEPTGYLLLLLVMFLPAFIFLKVICYPLNDLAQTASVSWANMARLFPDFAMGIFIYARTISAILGALTVYLIYCLAKELYGKRTALFSAGLLSVSMGFVGVNHFAKYKSLVNFLIVLTVFLCIKALNYKSCEKSKKYILPAFLAAGFASSVHLNALGLLVPLSVTFIFLYYQKKIRSNIFRLFFYILIFLAGVIIGTPSLLTHWRNYFATFWSIYVVSDLTNRVVSSKLPLFIGPLNYFFEILSIFGLPLFILTLVGLVVGIFSWKKWSKKEIIFMSFVSAYFVIITMVLEDKFPQTKHIIAIVPFLAIFAGKAVSDILSNRRLPKIAGYLIFTIIFLYSFAYSFKADLWFKKGDPRYESTRWIRENIPKGSKIELFDQLCYVASDDIIFDYEIIYLGRSSKGFRGKFFFAWHTVKGAREYLRYIKLHDSSSDYIIIPEPTLGIDYFFRTTSDNSYFEDRDRYLKALFTNQKNFKVVEVCGPKNRLVESKTIKGFFHLKNLWWDPIPSYRATAPTIYIFRRIESKND